MLPSSPASLRPLRVGAVAYLNTRPLTFCLVELARRAGVAAELVVDLPSRLADDLAAGRLDVAIVPSIEYFHHADYRILSDACISSSGPVRSVKLYGFVPPAEIRTLALDEGSRTSAALARILLAERFAVEPQLRTLPIGAKLADAGADAAVLIGDRAMQSHNGRFAFVWDLGEEWLRWTGLPPVFSMWLARKGIDSAGLDALFSAARDEGLRHLPQIARLAAAELQLPEADCLSYLRDNLVFHLGPSQWGGLETFYQLASRHGLVPTGDCPDFWARPCSGEPKMGLSPSD